MESFYAKLREFVTPDEETDEDDEIDIRVQVEDTVIEPIRSNHLECLYCYEVFTSEEELFPHERAHRTKNECICKWCNVQFSYTGWEYHYRKHTNDKRFKCDSCNKSFYMLQQLQSHLSHHKYSCTLCDQTFVTMKQVKSHGRLVHNFHIISDLVSLNVGRKSRKNRQRTRTNRPENASRSFEYRNANAAVKTEKVLRIENATKLFDYPKAIKSEKVFPVENSSKSFDWRFEYPKSTQTEKKIRIKGTSKTFVCKTCDLKFPKLFLLRDHFKRYPRCRPYSCNDCEATFAQKKKLEQHIRRHLYKCDSCSVNFYYKHELDMHMFNKHMLSVTGLKLEPSYPCQYCGLNWSSMEDLRNHIRLSCEDVFICARCFDLFDAEDEFAYHLREVHQIE